MKPVTFCIATFLGLQIPIVLAHDLEVPEPTQEKPKEVKAEKEELKLSHDEIVYVKALFKESVINQAVNSMAVMQYNSWGVGFVVHPEKNPVTQLVCKKIFKHYKDMEAQIYDMVGSNHNPTDEGQYLKKKLEDKINEDPKFYDELISAVKESIKHTSKEWIELSKNDK